MPTTPVQRGTALKLGGVAPTFTKLIVEAGTCEYIAKDYGSVVITKDNNDEVINYLFNDPTAKLSFEATTISGQTPPEQGDLITATLADASTIEFVVREAVPLKGFGAVQRAAYKLEKPAVDLSPA